MADKLSGDGVPFGRVDRALLWLVPAFLAYAGAKVGGSGVELYVAGALGVVAGVAVVRGIEAATGAPMPMAEADQRSMDRLAAVLKRSQEQMAAGMAQLDALQKLVQDKGATNQAFDLAKSRALLTVEESRNLASLAIAELQGARTDQRMARAERIAKWSAYAMWAAAVATTAALLLPLLQKR